MIAERRVHGIYAVTPEDLDDERLMARVEAALLGGARVVQYRNKHGLPGVRRRQATALLAVCRRHGALLLINDHTELAAAIGADGVHLGHEDGEIAQARAALGPEAVIGASCYNALENACQAEQAGASYVAFGSFFPSLTKPDAVRAPLTLLHEAKRRLSLPVVAIGGITPENGASLITAGADAIAVISALFDAPDVRAAASRLSRLFSEAREKP